MVEYFDSHVHLDFLDLADRAAVLLRAEAAQVTRLLVPGCEPVQWRKLEALAQRRFDLAKESRLIIRVGVGLHPYWSNELQREKPRAMEALLADMEHHISKLSAVAVGEMGLDKNKGAPPQKQIELFEAQLSLAKQLNLPVIMHQVGLQREFLASLKRVGLPAAGGVVHGFSGDVGWSKALIHLGLFLGVGAGIVHPRRDRFRQVVAQLPLGHVVLETDAPDARFFAVQSSEMDSSARYADIAPAFRSEPRAVTLVAQQLAQLLNTNTAEIARVTCENARDLFGF